MLYVLCTYFVISPNQDRFYSITDVTTITWLGGIEAAMDFGTPPQSKCRNNGYGTFGLSAQFGLLQFVGGQPTYRHVLCSRYATGKGTW